MERIAAGYTLAEAPAADGEGGLFFSDALAGGVFHWSPAEAEAQTVVAGRRGVGGMALHAEGGLVVGGRDVIHLAEGEERTLFADESIAGVNDLTVDPDGRLIVGLLRYRPFKGEPPVPGEFVRVERDGSTTDVITEVQWVNGCGFSPDGATFYGCDYARGIVLAANREADGGYGPARTVVESPSGEVDGMAVDEHGGLWVALGSGGAVGRVRPDGALEDRIDVPAGFVSSLCFGGSDGRDLFITTLGNPAEEPGAVFLARSPVAGAPLARMLG